MTNKVSCTLLNIGNCPTPPTNDTTDPGDQTPPTDTPPDQTDPADTANPTSSVSAAPNPAGGNSQVVTINGTLTDDMDLASYTLSLEGNVIQQADISGKSVDISAEWNVSTPNVVPSGQYTFILDVTDKAGKTGTNSTTITIDNDAPTVTVSGGGIIKSGSITPKVSATDDGTGVASYYWTPSSSNPAILDYTASDPQPTFTPTIEGTYVFYLDVTDNLGNVASHNEFDFGYKKELETVPLPTTTDPTDGLLDQSPSTPAIVAASANPATKTGRDEIVTSDDAGVLGNTITAQGQTPPLKTVATITATNSGWSIFGVLWYWWAMIIGIFFAGWLLIKKFVRRRIPENS